MGNGALASGSASTAMGTATIASGSSSTAMGYQTTASGEYSMAIGREIEANGDYNVAIALSDQNGLSVTQANTMAIMGGMVGVGTISPGYQLHAVINSSSKVAMFENQNQGTNSDGIIIEAGPNSNPGPGVDFVIFQDGDGSIVGTIDGNGIGGIMYNNSSDARLKTKIRDYSGGLQTVSQMKVRLYEKKSAPGNETIGFLAQELQEVYPQAVSGFPDSNVDDDPMMVDYSKITPLLVKAIQEQQELIKQLQAEIELLKNEK